eukprot:TRINITY_DN1125_c0_g1_i1.p1 TRINITY_DN1125_c0_g1~~TRINITY_DN1125_c0_g1_i1.p1  ORF type:complete len:371 (-),score=117.26 TRINITY_DN1125_c0_g1_i1:72-1184(-)
MQEEEGDENQQVEAQETKKNHNKYRRDKPWDNADINHWEFTPFKPGEMQSSLLEESSFSTLFPKYREKYLKEIWPLVVKSLNPLHIKCELDLIDGKMNVRTTRSTWDPYSIVKARDLMKLLSRSMPFQSAVKVLEDDMFCDTIKIDSFTNNAEKFNKRRQRLIGPNGATMKAIELLSNCKVVVQGKTVVSLGPHKGVKWVRQIVEDCMQNIHPIYNIKSMMIKRELAKDPEMSDQSWDRFLPSFKKKNIKKRKVKKPREKKEYDPFPPAQQPRKVDLEMESGEYFLKEKLKENKREKESSKSNSAPKPKNKAPKENSLESMVTKDERGTDEIKDSVIQNIKKRKMEQSSKEEKNPSKYLLQKKEKGKEKE